MALWRRVTNLFRIKQLNDEIDEELQSHLDEAVAQGRHPDEARRAFGSSNTGSRINGDSTAGSGAARS